MLDGRSIPPTIRLLELGFAFQEIFDLDSDFRLTAEHGSDLALLQVLKAGRVRGLRERHVLDLSYQIWRVLEIELDVLLDVRFVHRFFGDVDEDRAG